jgi:protein TonB
MHQIKSHKHLILMLFFLLINCNLHAQAVKDSSKAVDTTVFSLVEVDAEFPGGLDGWRNFLIHNLKGNTPVKKGAPLGTYRVIIQFIVSKDGSLSNFQAMTNFGYGMEEECIRVLKKSPKWQPAIQNGKTVNAYKRQPITFLVSN